MKFLICLTTACILFSTLYAQNFHLNTSFGVTNYSGDLQPKRYTFNQSHTAFSIGLSYEINEKLFLRSQFMTGKLSAHDKFNPLTAMRNLNFTSSLTEVQIGVEYYFRNLSEYTVSPYVFAGIAEYHFNPYTNDAAGTKYFLQPLSTEGQGFYPGRQPYHLTQLAIPFGGGIKMALSENLRVGVEFGLRKLFTDYLDDVSATYIDPNLLLANRGAKALELAYRELELKNGLPYQTGENRGIANTDWYYFTGITTSVRLGNSRKNGSNAHLSCPLRVN